MNRNGNEEVRNDFEHEKCSRCGFIQFVPSLPCEPMWLSGSNLVWKARSPGFKPRHVLIFSFSV